jgi:type IV secretory pathway VirB2 component (pilin)
MPLQPALAAMSTRGALDAEDLLKIVLALVIVWIAVEIVTEVVEFLLGPFTTVIGVVIVVLIVLWFFDKL